MVFYCKKYLHVIIKFIRQSTIIRNYNQISANWQKDTTTYECVELVQMSWIITGHNRSHNFDFTTKNVYLHGYKTPMFPAM